LTLRTYGALIALAFLAALRIAKRGAALRGLPEKFLMDLSMVLVLSGLVGARLFYVVLNPEYYLARPWEIFKIWEGGLVFYGGFLAAAAAGFFYSRHHQMPVATVADCLTPGLALGQAIGRWGCFFAGCCYGKPSTMPWAVRFKDPNSLAPLNITLHPVQIYEALGSLVIAFTLWAHLTKRPDAPKGQTFWLYVFSYGLLRFFMEMFRGDDRGPLWAGLYPSQAVAVMAMLVAASILIAQIASTGHLHGTPASDRK
jgi:phosphatidylglycerol:prolipoprotein diacylglycerol transferase